ncbi:MAG TPA: hypothetical protein VL087_07370 [Nitrospirota bacterium]|nr:hypothetical protein [Nitrospirota bacterium]
MGVVLYLVAVAFISISACGYASLFTMPFVSDAWAQPATPDQPVTPPAQQEEQNIPQPPQEQTGPKAPEAPPAGPSQPPQEQTGPKAPEAPPAGPSQPPQEQTGPKAPEAPPAGPSQPPPGQPSSEQKKPEQEAPKKPEEGQEQVTIFDILHGWTDKSILTTATWVDSFFGNQRYLAESNQSYVRFRYNVFLEHESPLLIKPDVQVRIVLPQLKELTHLEFAGTPKETTILSPTQAPATTDQFTNPDKSFTAGVSQFLRDTKRVNFVVRAGLQWHQGGPVVILGPRLRILFPLDHWTLRFVEEVIVRNDNGYQQKTTFDLERPVSRDLFFRATNDWIRTDHVDGYLYDIIFNLAHPLGPKKALEYEWVNIFQTQPVSELTEVDLRIRYRQRIWRDWLYFEVAPQYRFPRDRSFEPTPGILFRLETIFGHYQ